MSDIQLVAYDTAHSPYIRAIREAVFMQEQGVSPELEFDGLDAYAMHVLAVVDGEYVGTGRMQDDGHIGRIAILQNYRGLGLGAKIVQKLVAEAVRLGYPRVYLGAQTHAVDFYAKLGFTPYGDEFMDAGIPHMSMEKSL
ncbi:MAG: GNAT family N-acetyltransferase [Oceanisphaera sp.]|uniref:GNAT family N-acetyltransferase n=1 Tax=Oceanisphaera sp. TaxID=1929979 RepID=UPI003C761ABA